MTWQLKRFVDREGVYQVTNRVTAEIAHCSQTEGVYCLLDGTSVLYVGTAMNLRYRLRQHFNSQMPWVTAMFRDVPYQDGLDRGELEMSLLWDYLPPYNRAYNFNKTFVPMSSFVWESCFTQDSEIFWRLRLHDSSAPEKKLRSLLWRSGIEIRIHRRIDGQHRNLMNRDELDKWLCNQTGWSLKISQQEKEAWRESLRQSAMSELQAKIDNAKRLSENTS